jgi:hypothetical protein
MPTLIAVHVHGSCVARCDAKCYDGQSPRESCVCLCGGDNHGAGLLQAVANTELRARRWEKSWRAAHPQLAPHAQFTVHLYEIMIQNSFFPEMTCELAVRAG